MLKKVFKQLKTGLLFLTPLLIWDPVLMLHEQMLILWGVWFLIGVSEQEGFKPPNRDTTQPLILCSAGFSAACGVLWWAYGAQTPPTDLQVGLGFLVMSIGLAIRIWALVALGANFSQTAATNQQQTLQQNGPYRLIRHPAYSGSVLIFVGQALFLGSYAGALLSLLIMFYAYQKRTQVEEAALLANFEQDYSTYQQATKKFIPYIY